MFPSGRAQGGDRDTSSGPHVKRTRFSHALVEFCCVRKTGGISTMVHGEHATQAVSVGVMRPQVVQPKAAGATSFNGGTVMTKAPSSRRQLRLRRLPTGGPNA